MGGLQRLRWLLLCFETIRAVQDHVDHGAQGCHSKEYSEEIKFIRIKDLALQRGFFMNFKGRELLFYIFDK